MRAITRLVVLEALAAAALAAEPARVEEFRAATGLGGDRVGEADVGHSLGAQEVAERVVAVRGAGAQEDEVEDPLKAAGVSASW